MTTTMPQRAERSLRLLLGMRLPRVSVALRPYGFSHAVVTEGWSLMAALTPENELGPGQLPEQAIEQLEDFGATWFPVANAVLIRHFPEQARLLFQGIGVAEGQLSPVVATIFVDRVGAMSRGEDPFFEDGPSAWNKVKQHGFSDEILQKTRVIADGALSKALPSFLERSAAREQEASDALWDWYLQWSRIVRAAVKNKVLLRSMGFEPATARRKVSASQTHSLSGKTTQVRVLSEKRTASEESSQRPGARAEAKTMGSEKR